MLGKKPAIEWFAPDKLPGSGAPGELPITCDNFSPAERHHRNALTHHPFKGTVVTIIMQMRMTDVGALLGVKNYDIGIGAKAVVTGDITQIDLPKGHKSGLKEAIDVLHDVRGLAFTQFRKEDVVRHPLVARIVDAYEKRQQTT